MQTGELRMCDPSWVFNEITSSCFRVYDELLSPSQAKRKARTVGGHLGFIRDEQTQRFVMELITNTGRFYVS